MTIQLGEPSSVAGHAQIDALVRASPDPLRISRFLADLRSRHPGQLAQTLGLVHGPESLAALPLLSRFLSDEVLRHPEWLDCVAQLGCDLGPSEFKIRLDAFCAANGDLQPAHALAMYRRKELLRIALRDGLALAGVAKVTSELSFVADAILARALAIVTREVEQRHGSPQTSFVVISLGKLGGNELNYSSDVDLMFLYRDKGQTTGDRSISNKEFFKKVANQLTASLSSYTGAGICYRVDLRLRPEGSLGEVAISLEGAREYYAKRARDWELQMLIKARPCAGDLSLAHELLSFVEPAIYASTLDFSTIETMAATRDRITEKLAKRKFRETQLDVKLAPGGIRDIEFLVQCLQRLHGARDASVRHGGTLFALSRLFEKGLLSDSEHGRLSSAYQFLRHLEHRLQLEDDRQTHLVPSDNIELERLAMRMPGGKLKTPSQLLQALNTHLESVQALYDRIVHAQRPLSYSIGGFAPPAPEAAFVEPGSVKAGLQPVAHGIAQSTVSTTAAEAYRARIEQLSPYLSEQLKQTPELAEEIQHLADYPSVRPAFEALAGPLHDLEGLRRFFRRQMFRILAGSVSLPEPVFASLDRTSGLAEFMIARAYRVAFEQELAKGAAEPTQQMTVIGLGRLGMREFDLGSDADIVFVVPDPEAERLEFWTRVASRMIDILTRYQGDGPILSIDTRLRPNGREGMLVQTESSFTTYFANKAEAWEGIAYMKARGLAGDLDRATRFLSDLQQVDWRRYGQGGRSRPDLRQMRLRLQREHGAAVPLKAGEGGYYDADFILMYLRLKGAGLFFKSLNTPERIDIVEKMGHLERGDAEFLLQATTYLRAVDHAVRIVRGKASERLPEAAAEKSMVADLVQLWTGNAGTTPESIEEDLDRLRHRMRRLFDSVFH